MTEEDTVELAVKEPRASACEVCGYPLKTIFNPNDTSTWRVDNFCSARCKRRSKKYDSGRIKID